MSLNTLDAKIVVIYAILTVIIGFMFPALGMAGTAQTADDVPEFNVSQTRFDFVDDLPEFPSEPTSGVLNHSSDKFDDFRGNIQVELGPGDDGNRTFLVAINETAVHITDVEAGAGNQILDVHNFTSEGETHTLEGNGYTIDVHAVDLEHGEFEWVATETPGNSDVPLIGGALDTADAVANGIFWIASTIVVLVLMIVEAGANLGGLMFDTVTLFIDYGSWIVGFATTIISNAPGYAAAIIAVIYSPMYWVFAKMVMTVINMVNPFG